MVGVRQSATAVIAFCIRSSSVWKSVRGPGQRALGHQRGEHAAHGGHVQAVAEVLARTGEHDRAHLGVGVQLREHLGSSAQKAGPIALPLPGPISVTCATWSLISTVTDSYVSPMPRP